MKKNLFILITIFVIVLLFIVYGLYDYNKKLKEAGELNKTYESYYQKEVLGTNVASLINKSIDHNEKNAIDKDEKGIYIQNSTDSIKIEIKFLESDKTFSMELVDKQKVESFIKNFGASTFKCTKMEYHKNTKQVKYLYFEQLQ